MTRTHDCVTNELVLENPPNDCIQRVRFGQNDNQHLLTASWDSSVRLYDTTANQLMLQYTHDAPVFDVAFQGYNTCWSGGADNKIKKYDFQSQQEITVGQHSAPIKCVEYIPEVDLVATGGWDKNLKLWDARCADTSRSSPVASRLMPDKIYSMSVCGDKLIVGLASRKILIMDLKNMTHIQRESLLKYQLRCVEAFADKRGYVVGSIEGRVAVQYLDPSPEAQKQNYAFKCHRNKDPATGLEIIYPVNALSFHSKFNTFATGGSDGFVSIWDGRNKKRLIQFHRYPTSISSLSFSPDGSTLAIACSQVHANEETDTLLDTPQDSIHIRRVSDQEARNKS